MPAHYSSPSLGAVFLVSVLGLGCSALIDPDATQLGDPSPLMDAGTPDTRGDAGRLEDTGPFDAGPDTGPEPDAGCSVDCDDGVACTTDVCRGDTCGHSPDNALCGDGFRCASTGCVPAGCTMDAECDDGLACTDDSCSGGSCTSTPRDGDGDGAPAASVEGMMCVSGTDCDDGNAMIGPGAMELCDGLDNNCNGSTDEGCGPLPDTCASAEPIELDGARRGRVSGTFASLDDDYVTGALCGSARGRDAVYYVDLPGGTWDMSVDTIGSGANTVLGLGSDCSVEGLGLICNDDMDPARTEASRIFTHRVQSFRGIRLYILVQGNGAAERGDYVVNVAVEPAHPDTCNFGGDPLDITGGGTVLGFQTGFAGSDRGSCMPRGDFDEESVFTFESSSAAPTLTVYSSDFVPDLFMRAGCASDSEVACDVGTGIGGGVNAASISPTIGPSTRQFVYVDGRGSYVLIYTP